MTEVLADLNKNQETHAPNGWGGAREGAGRKKHSRDKLKITDFFTPEEIDQAVMEAKLLAFGDGNTKPDKDMLKFIIEQVFGKAKQRQVQEDEEGNTLAPVLVKILRDGDTGNSN